MAIGPGKYDEECTQIRVKQAAEGVIVIVFGGLKGNGFSCQGTIEMTLAMPSILRQVAEQIENSGAPV